MNSQGSPYLGLWREAAPGAVCLRSGRRPIFISRLAMRGNMGYEQAGFPDSSLIPDNVLSTQKSNSKIRLKGPSATSSVESAGIGPPAVAAGGDSNGSKEYKKMSHCQNYDWLKDLNEVTKFNERNIGHDHLFRVEEERDELTGRFQRMRDGSEGPFPRAKQVATPKGDHGRDRTLVRFSPKTAKGDRSFQKREATSESPRTLRVTRLAKVPIVFAEPEMSEDLDDSLVNFVVPADHNKDQDTISVGGGIPRTNLASATKHCKGERDVGGSGDAPKIIGTVGMRCPSEDQNKNEDICREFRLKAKLDNQLDLYMGLWDKNGNKCC